MSVRLEGTYFKQMRLLRPNNDNIVNIYIVYLIDPIINSRNTYYTVQNALFGGVKIPKNATDTSKHKYEGYGICFDEGGMFSMENINNGRNVLIFGVHENSVIQLLWAMELYKVLMIRLCTLKNFIVKILLQ